MARMHSSDYTLDELDSMYRERQKLKNEKRKKSTSIPRFTIAQIERYLNGKRVLCADGRPHWDKNQALDLAISCLRDEHDGIGAELKRDKDRQRMK